MKKFTKYFRKMAVSALSLSMAFSFTALSIMPASILAASHPFADVPAGVWYEQDAADCFNSGIFTGKNTNTFAPADPLKIAEAMALAARIHARLHNETIPAATGVWYQPSIDYLKTRELLDPNGNYESRVNEIITRSDMVHILYPALDPQSYASLNEIQDDAIPDVMSGSLLGDEIYAFYRSGIANGIANTHYFKPGRVIQRAEVAAIVNRMINPAKRVRLSLYCKPVPDLNAPITQENVLALLEGLDPNGYFIATHNRDQPNAVYEQSLLSWFEGESRIADGLPIAVHEENHFYTHLNPTYNFSTGQADISSRFYLGAEDFIIVPHTPVFSSKEIYDSIDPQIKEHFYRLDTYIGPQAEDNLASVMYGPYGMMNEWNSYCWDLNTTLRMAHYRKNDGLQDGAGCQAYAEFGFMIIHYLLYASQVHPDVYAGIMNNAAFKQAFDTILVNYRTLVEEVANRDDIRVLNREDMVALLDVLDQPPYKAIVEQLTAL